MDWLANDLVFLHFWVLYTCRQVMSDNLILKTCFSYTYRVATSRPPSPPLLSPSVRPSSSFLALQIYLYQSSLYQPHLYPTYCISVLISIALCLPPSLSLSTKLIPIKLSIIPIFIKLISPKLFLYQNYLYQTNR